ncbi:prepilin-type N-terminal cleavage/methylation domain-containing protein [Candidatus Parabeggiatoa sp. HSG14]|uniref:prepilin-type N-terminal cleavage/methylation domain-containing protein n=1 Tax=Candidatus Parabeggiatoa sp. HSG14 TaxID=3055593 RepID=UPI0025A918EC|nr:prepilin-type N-terminal cleavage/methylation domain-containing protein [Thiotrichales bacterium HSG14]
MKNFNLPFFKGRNFRGFSLLEMLVVLAILGMAMVLVIPNLSTSQSAVLKAQVRDTMAMLKYKRRSAIVEGKVAIFDPNKKEGFDAKTTDKPTKKHDSGEWVSRGVNLQCGGELRDNEKADCKITFYPEGGSSGGEIIFTHLDYKAKITVNPITGKIKSDIFEDNDENK